MDFLLVELNARRITRRQSPQVPRKELAMISMTKGHTVEPLHAVVIVAFDRASGKVHGSFVHGSLGGPDEAGIKRSREKFVAELKTRLGSGVALDTIQLPLEELKDAWVDRVDPATRQAIKAPHNARTSIKRP
jgi:hypothetical protein